MPREEEIAFMNGLAGVLDWSSGGLRARMILPSLLEISRTRIFWRAMRLRHIKLRHTSHKIHVVLPLFTRMSLCPAIPSRQAWDRR